VAVCHEARYRIAGSDCCTSKNALGIEKAVQVDVEGQERERGIAWISPLMHQAERLVAQKAWFCAIAANVNSN
jgi:predicted RNA-binding protein YlxR (DUF448 family)